MNDAAANVSYLMAFLPWLRLRTAATVLGVTFTPIDIRSEYSPFGDLRSDIEKILSGYVDIRARRITHPTIVFIEREHAVPWHLHESDVERVTRAVNLLLLAGFSSNTYFQTRSYVNTPPFETLWQKFRVPAKWISLETRRRDGSSLSGGYEHGELKFTIPVQNRYASEVDADQALLDALTLADAKEFPVLQRLETALPAFALANTDSATLTRQQELVWMAAAFETFLDSGSQCNHLVKKFPDQWKHYGTVKISETLSSTNRFAGLKQNDANTFIHSVWIRELCVLRGMTIHSSPLHKRQNMWDDFQHLLMGSFVFPLLVKVLLSQESLYLMTPEDAGSARAVDKLLCLSDWGQDPKLHHSSEQSIWQDTINDEILAHIIEQGTQELLKGLNDNQGGSS